MGIQHSDGYSASVEAHLVVGGQQFSVSKVGRDSFTLAESCDLPLGTEGELVIIIDGHRNSRMVVLDEGATRKGHKVRYSVAAPF
jgi:hypothetical protein